MSIEKIFALGDDALTNLWEINIGLIPYIDDMSSTTLRIQSVIIPGTGANTYPVNYKTQVITKTGGKVNAPNEFTFDFRVDKNWAIYKGFVAWKNAVANSYTGVIGEDSNLRVPIDVWAVDSNDDPIVGFGKWSFKGCYPSNVGDISLSYDSGDPIIVTITMNFLALDDNGL